MFSGLYLGAFLMIDSSLSFQHSVVMVTCSFSAPTRPHPVLKCEFSGSKRRREVNATPSFKMCLQRHMGRGGGMVSYNTEKQ